MTLNKLIIFIKKTFYYLLAIYIISMKNQFKNNFK